MEISALPSLPVNQYMFVQAIVRDVVAQLTPLISQPSTVDASKKIKSEKMSIPELAEYLGVNVRTIKRLVLEKKIPYHKVGIQVRFKKTDVDKYIKSREVLPPPPPTIALDY